MLIKRFTRRRLSRWLGRFLLLLTLPGMLLGSSGCTRRFYRNKADKAVSGLLTEKSDDPRWGLDGYHVYPNPLARFADPSNPDRPPMPPDDPGAHDHAPNPQKPPKAGIAEIEGTGYLELLKRWDAENRAEAELRKKQLEQEEPKEKEVLTSAGDAPPPQVIREEAEAQARRDLSDATTITGLLPEERIKQNISQEKPYLIKLDQAVELGLINSREYQTRREQLYLTALPVTLERFAFAPQFYAVQTSFRERFGKKSPDGYVNRWRFNQSTGFSQLFPTGALLLFSFANRTVINLGKVPDISVSEINIDILQPLLQGGGFAVTLEPLTQAERNLLYSVRDFARFRQEFFVFIAAGQPTFIPGQQAGVQAITGGTVQSPGVFVPAAAPIADVLGGAILASPQVVPGRGGRLFNVNVGSAPPQGFLSALGEKANLVNSYRNIDALRRYKRLFEGYLEGGIVNAVQVGQVEQQLLRSVDNYLSSRANYRNSLDQFKLQLGVPMNVPLELEDGPLQSLFDQTRRFEDISASFEATAEDSLQYNNPADAGKLRARLRKLLTDGPLVKQTAFGAGIGKRLDMWAAVPTGIVDKTGLDELGRKLKTLRDERNKLREEREKLREKEKGDLSEKDRNRLQALDSAIELGTYEQALRNYEKKPWVPEKSPVRRINLQNSLFSTVRRQFLAVIDEAFRERQEKVNKQWPALPALCVDGVDLLQQDDDTVTTAVSRAAMNNRLDLMNQRAQVVDSWRKIKVAANALLGTFTPEYRFNTFTPLTGSQPFNFGNSRNQHRFILNTELPLVRIAERNNYRSTLIGFQQQRRQLQAAEDNLLFSVRLDLRQLRASAQSYHQVQKRQVELAYLQVDQALQAFSQPQPPQEVDGPPTSGGGAGDPAALTQQLLQAQNSLLQAQNSLYNTWIGYLTTRMSLYRDMGLMPLDPRGVWIDDVATCCPIIAGSDGSGGNERPPEPDKRPTGPSGGERPETLPAPRPIEKP